MGMLSNQDVFAIGERAMDPQAMAQVLLDPKQVLSHV